MADLQPVQSNDNYQAFLSDKLWNMIPAIYRTLDTDSFNSNGPLREMVNRIGASAAVLRRSIDRLWEDQSIETCDDWVIPYIGDLLATNLVNSLDARGQRLDVAKTVYYRQRKGTVAILEEIAADITGWNARVVEFFRRMGRTRHNFDPPVGLPAAGPTSATQLVATGDGATTAFPTVELLNTPIYRGTLQVVVNGSAVGSDNGAGAIVASGGSGLTGTIEYGTGAIMLTFATAPVGGAAITVLYDYLGFDASLQIAEGITGSLTGSQIGGWADLRNVYGAAKAQTAFDEFSHAADFRLGVDMVGWQNISHLGVFLWRLYPFAAGITTPVASTLCPGQYSFDPTGRMIPLFAAASRNSSSYGDNWVSPQEWQLPGPISLPLMQMALENPQQIALYATAVDTATAYSVTNNSLGVYSFPGSYYELLPSSLFLNALQQTTIYPEWGVFQVVVPPSNPPVPPFFVTYNYGFSSTIGAGPYDRRLPGVAADVTPGVVTTIAQAPPNAPPDIPDPSPTGTIAIQDSLTYTAISNFTGIANVTVQAAPQTRPVLRWPAPSAGSENQWTFNGASSASFTGSISDATLTVSGVTGTIAAGQTLMGASIPAGVTITAGSGSTWTLGTGLGTIGSEAMTASAANNLLVDGLLISGADVVLTGSFDSVTLRCCTLDPGNGAVAGAVAALFTGSISGATLTVSGITGTIAAGQTLMGASIPAGVTITTGSGSTWTLSTGLGTIGSEAMTASNPSDIYARSVDQRDLTPTRLWIEATVNTLVLDRCITGPIRTRMGGNVGTLSTNDSIIQGIPSSILTEVLQPADILDQLDFVQALLDKSPLSTFLQGKMAPAVLQGLQQWNGEGGLNTTLLEGLLSTINEVIQTNFYTQALFAGIPLDPSITMLPPSATANQLIQFNRQLFEAAFPVALAQAGIALSSGEADLNRTTVLGRTFVHRIEASECILDDFTVVEDTQHGCVRFTAWPVGSVVPRQYESVQIDVQSPLFTSREFGQPGYGQLLASADLAIVSSGGGTILQGAQDGSEMGAFAREKNPVKENSILIKYQEYMPLGLAPVLIRVT
jgi:hypothetical protein